MQRQSRVPFILLSSLIIIFAGWATLVATNSSVIQSFDQNIIAALTNTNAGMIKFAQIFTTFANTSTMVVLTLIFALLMLALKKWRYSLLFVATMIFSNLTNTIIKNSIQRARPAVKHLVHAGGYSFPSGHSIASMMIALLLIIFLHQYYGQHRWAKPLAIIIGLFPFIIGFTRIFLHVHYPSDVFGGFLLAFIFATIDVIILQKFPNYFQPAPSLVATQS